MSDAPVVIWYRQDLRIGDHPALRAAVATGAPVVPLYVLDDETPGAWRPGGASRWWLAMSLARLSEDLASLGSPLVIRRGPARREVVAVAREVGAAAVHATRLIAPWAGPEEEDIKAALADEGIGFRRFAGALLFEPEALRTGAGGTFRVFTPFSRAAMAAPEPRNPLPAPSALMLPKRLPKSLQLNRLGLLPTKPDWAGGLRNTWRPGEAGAHRRLEAFVADRIDDYKAHRDRVDLEATSRLSPHLHFGEISPNACWWAVRPVHGEATSAEAGPAAGAHKFRQEVLWREFSYHLLRAHPDLPDKPLRAEFQRFPWRKTAAHVRRWQRGQTGYPIVDAAMRQLWQTGWMHNRARMIAASFLIKDLLLPWQEGEAWFWDTLVDADLASNAASWQWVAGCGADAAPYFRVFNPTKQGLSFDPDGSYVRSFVPELAGLAAPDIHAPHEAPAAVLAAAGVEIGRTYPHPIVDHAAARRQALQAFEMIRQR